MASLVITAAVFLLVAFRRAGLIVDLRSRTSRRDNGFLFAKVCLAYLADLVFVILLADFV